MAEREVKRISAKFTAPVVVGDVVINADRETKYIFGSHRQAATRMDGRRDTQQPISSIGT